MALKSIWTGCKADRIETIRGLSFPWSAYVSSMWERGNTRERVRIRLLKDEGEEHAMPWRDRLLNGKKGSKCPGGWGL